MSVIAAKLRRLIYGDFFIYRNRMKIHKKDCLGKRQPSLKPVNLAGYRRRTAIWFKKHLSFSGIHKSVSSVKEPDGIFIFPSAAADCGNENEVRMRKSGILLPVFSLPGLYGIGGFSREAREFIDYLAGAGQSL